jgi:hypothetical protein
VTQPFNNSRAGRNPPTRWLTRATVSAALLATPLSVFGQQNPTGTTVTVTYYWLDSILVGALCLAALFAICKSSRRS